MYMTGYQCIRCDKILPLDYPGFICPVCESNLEVIYDYEQVSDFLKNSFPANRNDIFKYLPLLPIADTSHAPSLRVGSTPLYHAPALGETIGLKNLYLKDEGLNPSASFKDRASAVAVARAIETGAPMTAGASTGNAGSSMACMSANLGVPCVIFVPEAAPPAKLTQLLIFGAHVMAVKGSYDDAFDLCMRVCAQHGWFNRNTGFNPFTREGKKTCSFELWEQFDGSLPDWIVVPSGDGNIISGIWKGLKELQSIGFISTPPRLLCAQSENSDAISRTVHRLKQQPSFVWKDVQVETVQATTIADSISVDIPRDGLAAVRAVIESEGAAVTSSDAAILDAMAELAQKAGIFAEPAAAVTWASLRKAVAGKIISPDERIACIITGNGLKDVVSARKAVKDPTPVAADISPDNAIFSEVLI